MAEFSIRSDSVDVEQIMRQIRERIKEKRGVDYTEQQIQEMASVKLEKFLDPKGVRSDLLEHFRRSRVETPPPPNYTFESTTLYQSNRAIVRFFRKLLNPVLKLFFNPNPLIQALHIQSEINARYLQREELYYEVMHNLVVEITRLGIEVKNAKMRVESISSRLDFSERRARALETVVQYRPEVTSPKQAPREPPGAEAPRQAATREAPADAQMAFSQPGQGPGEGLRSRRRRRRRGRRAGSSGAPVTASSIPGPDAEVRLSPRQDTGPAAGGQLETSERPGAAPLQDRPPDIAIERPAPPSAEPPVPTPDRSGPIEQ